ncbi:MAG: IclR family transcriptional regulator [bacterium]|nr:IclR family transcriptional regulator [bacterium]
MNMKEVKEEVKAEKGTKTGKRLIQSIERAADILALFVTEKRALGIAEFAQELSLPKTTIQGIVNTLVARDYLERDPVTSKYRLGPMLFQLGMKYATNMDLVTITRVWMERLCFQFREPVNGGMLVGDKVVVVLRTEPDNKFMVFPQAGSVIPTHSSCIGKVLFAYMEPEKRDRLLENYIFESLTPNSITNREDFEKEIAEVKKTGVAFDREENLVGLGGIGGPFFNHTGEVIAAFALTGNAKHINEKREEIVNAVVYTSTVVSSQLGFKRGGEESV